MQQVRLFKSKKGYEMKGHILIGAGIIAILWYLNTIYKWMEIPATNQFYLQIAAITLVYSLLPDSDQPGSIISRYITLLLGGIAVLAFLGYLQMEAGVLAVGIIVALRWVGHRQVVHSVLSGLLASLPLYYFFGLIHFIVGLVAYISHIVADNDFSWGWEPDHRMKVIKSYTKR